MHRNRAAVEDDSLNRYTVQQEMNTKKEQQEGNSCSALGRLSSK